MSHESMFFVAGVVLASVIVASVATQLGWIFYARSMQKYARALQAHQRELQNLLLNTAKSGKASVNTRAFAQTQDATREFENVPDQALEEAMLRETGRQVLEEAEPDRFGGLGGMMTQ